MLVKISLAHPNHGKRSTDNFTKISPQISRHLWQRKTEKNFTFAVFFLFEMVKKVLRSAENREPPDVGLAPTALWRVPPSPEVLEDPSPKPHKSGTWGQTHIWGCSREV